MTQDTTTDILELVREFRDGGGFYDDDAVRFVADRLGCERSRELSRACYKAKGALSDEKATARYESLLAEGFVPVEDGSFLIVGDRCDVLPSTLYVGRDVPDYPANPTRGRLAASPRGCVFLPGRNRTNGWRLKASDLVRIVNESAAVRDC